MGQIISFDRAQRELSASKEAQLSRAKKLRWLLGFRQLALQVKQEVQKLEMELGAQSGIQITLAAAPDLGIHSE